MLSQSLSCRPHVTVSLRTRWGVCVHPQQVLVTDTLYVVCSEQGLGGGRYYVRSICWSQRSLGSLTSPNK